MATTWRSGERRIIPLNRGALGERPLRGVGPVAVGASAYAAMVAQVALAKAQPPCSDNLTLNNFHVCWFRHETASQSGINSFTHAATAAVLADVVDRLHRRPLPAARRRRARLSLHGRPWSQASSWRSHSTPSTRRRRFRCSGLHGS